MSGIDSIELKKVMSNGEIRLLVDGKQIELANPQVDDVNVLIVAAEDLSRVSGVDIENTFV